MCLSMLRNRGIEYCGKVDEHAYQLFFTVEKLLVMILAVVK